MVEEKVSDDTTYWIRFLYKDKASTNLDAFVKFFFFGACISSQSWGHLLMCNFKEDLLFSLVSVCFLLPCNVTYYTNMTEA